MYDKVYTLYWNKERIYVCGLERELRNYETKTEYT